MKLAKAWRAARWPRVEFLPSRHGAGWRSWAVLAAACALLATALLDWADARDVDRHASADATFWRREAQRRALPSRPQASAPKTQDQARRSAAQRAAEALRHPWPQVFAAIDEASLAGAQWRAMSYAPAEQGEMRLEGQAADAAALLRVVDTLAAHGEWATVSVTRLTLPDSGEPGPLRFEIGGHRPAAARVQP